MSNTTANASHTCATCGRDLGAPYRRIADGRIVEGCISRAHEGKLYGESLRWHMRPTATQFRKDSAKHEKATFGHVLSDIRA